MLEVLFIFAFIFVGRIFTPEREYKKLVEQEIKQGLKDGSIEANMRRGKNER